MIFMKIHCLIHLYEKQFHLFVCSNFKLSWFSCKVRFKSHTLTHLYEVPFHIYFFKTSNSLIYSFPPVIWNFVENLFYFRLFPCIGLYSKLIVGLLRVSTCKRDLLHGSVEFKCLLRYCTILRSI